jgi:cell volume regulation protein A
MSGGGLDLQLLAGTAVLLVAIAGVRFSTRSGVPSLLLYLGIGVVLGEDVIGLRFDDVRTARDLGLVALAVIVAEGGLTTQWSAVRPVLPTALLLSTVGVAVTVAVTAVAAHAALDLGWREAALTGAVVGSTDAAAVFSTLRHLSLPRRLVTLLEAESGLNDAPVVIAVTLLSSRHVHGAGDALLLLGYELVVGAAIGVAVGLVAVAGLRRAALPAVGLYPIATLALALSSYAAAASAQASGFLAVYVTALMLGNARLPHRRATLGFADGLAWLAQIGLFVMLGLLAVPSRLGSAVVPALVIAVVLLLVARPLSVIASMLGGRFAWRDRAFVAAGGLRGAVPIVLATIPMTEGVRDATRLFDVVFVLVALLTCAQAPALAPLARALHLVAADPERELDVEAAPLDRLDADLLTVHVGPASRLHGVEVWELRLPAEASVAFVVREDRGFVPDRRTVLRHGDDILVITARAHRDAVERRMRLIGRTGRLGGFVRDDEGG